MGTVLLPSDNVTVPIQGFLSLDCYTVPKLSVFRGILNKYMIRIAAELIVCMKLYEMISTADPNVQYSSGCGLACQVIYQPDINHHFQLTWLWATPVVSNSPLTS